MSRAVSAQLIVTFIFLYWMMKEEVQQSRNKTKLINQKVKILNQFVFLLRSQLFFILSE